MADLSEENLEAKQDEFEGEQLDAVNALEAANPDNVDLGGANPLAVQIGLISTDTVDAINEAMPNHNLLFQRALAKERGSRPGPDAFKHAFRSVYGKFLLEEGDTQLEADGSPLMTKLKAVLKFPVGPTGLQGRTELLAAVRRLKMLRVAGTIDPDEMINNAFATSKTAGERKGLEREYNDEVKAQKKLKTLYDFFSESENIDALTEPFTELKTLVVPPAAGDEPFNSKIRALSNEIDGLKSARNAVKNMNENQISQEVDKLERIHIRDNPGVPFDRDRAAEDLRTRPNTQRNELSTEIAEKDLELSRLTEVKAKAEAFRKILSELVTKLKLADEFGLKDSFTVTNPDGTTVDHAVSDLDTELGDIRLTDNDFHPQQLIELYEKFGGFFEDNVQVDDFLESFDQKMADQDDDVDKAKRKLSTAKSEVSLVSNLSDAAAGKRLIAAIVAEQNPEMSLADQQKLASLILADDVATMQTEADYDELAKRGSAELIDTVRQAGFQRKLIGLQYEEGGSTQHPFKDLKPEDFDTWPKIERLFKIGRLNHQNGFLVLAAFKNYDGFRSTPSIQSVKLEKKLKEAIAEELGVDERMDESGVSKILNKAFADQMKKATQLVDAYFTHHDRNVDDWDFDKINELNLRYKHICELRKRGKHGGITNEVFKKRLDDLIEEAEDAELIDQVDFSQNTILAEFWNSPFSQWFRDRGHDVGKYLGRKSGSVLMSGVKLGLHGVWGTTKLGLSGAYQTAMAPVRLAKYPLMVAAKPFVGFINLFRRQKWTPLPRIRDTVRNDAGRVAGYFKEKATGTAQGAGEKLTTIPVNEWNQVSYDHKNYAERSKLDPSSLKEQAEELKEKGDPTPLQVAGSPYISLDRYKKELADLDKILGQKPVEERGDDTKTEAA